MWKGRAGYREAILYTSSDVSFSGRGFLRHFAWTLQPAEQNNTNYTMTNTTKIKHVLRQNFHHVCACRRVCQCKRHTLTQKVFHCASLSGIACATSTCVAREPAYACMVAALQLRLTSGKWHMRLLPGCRTLCQQHPGTISLPLRFFGSMLLTYY